MFCMPGSGFKLVFLFSRFICSSIHIHHMIPAEFLKWNGPATDHRTSSLARTAAAISSIKKTVGQAALHGMQQVETAGLVCHNKI